jgi:2,4-dienoyl-CoA reductase-like NADH-dependent reductase (Old Yellow Enzyme family)
MDNSELFLEGRIGGLKLSNRMIRTASHEGLSDEEGRPTDETFEFYKGFVKGGVGMIITGYAGIHQSGKSALYHMTMIDMDELIPAHKSLVDRIHGIGGKIVLQIAHCGRQTWSRATKQCLMAPSALPCGFYKELPREMTDDDIHNVIHSFATAARRTKEAGYDGVQIHGAHGYLLFSFLSQHSNRRRDKWGGSLENRFRIVAEVLKSVREAVGSDYPVLIKLNTYERAWRGMRPNECAKIARMVEETDCCDAIEFSCGTNEGGFVMARGRFPTWALFKYMRPYCNYHWFIKSLMKIFVIPFVKMMQPPFVEGYNLAAAAMAKKSISLPVITVGGMRSKYFMENAIKLGQTDFVSMARPLIREPDLPNKFKDCVSNTALCDNCNDCVVACDTQPIQCYKEAALG